MLSHSKIEKEALLIGMGNYVELWNPGVFEDNLGMDGDEFSDLAQKYLDE
jgi:MraZ protein